MKKILTIMFLVFLTSGLYNCSQAIGLKNLYGQNDLQLNSSQLKRFEDYLKGEYYSFELQRRVSHKPIMFAISNDGSASLIFSCVNLHEDCNESIEIYQFLKRYSKKSGKDLRIFALKNKIVWAGNNLQINKDFNFKNSFLNRINFTNVNNIKNIFYDISIFPKDSKDNDFE